MDVISGDISAVVFRRVVRGDLGEFSFDGHMLRVLMELDGKRSVAGVAQHLGLNMGAMRGVISRLLQLGLIEPVEGVVSMFDREFFDYLVAQLSLAIGPIAEVLAEDAVMDLGLNPSQFPSHRAAELVDLLARQIQREEKRTVFKHNMVKKINAE